MMEHRRSWTVALGDKQHRVDVVYAALSGWMSIEVDGTRQARGWREYQTVFGGASLSCEFDRHRLEARVTQPWGRQEYAFALAVDGELQPGSDPQPESRALRRRTLVAIGWLAVTIAVFTLIGQIVSRAG